MGKHNYIVLTTQRTGSSMFMDTLNEFPGIDGHMELFLDQMRMSPPLAGKNTYPRYCEWAEKHLSIRPFSVWRYLSGLYSSNNSAGFKLMYSHVRNYPEALPYLLFKRTKIIHLIRQNYLDIILSEKIAEITGKSHTTDSSEENNSLIYLDSENTLDRIRKLNDNTASMRKIISTLFTCPSIEVYYEDILKDRDSAFSRVQTFLGINKPVQQLESSLKKRQTRPKKEVISNYEEISQLLTKAGFEYLLDS
jgi:LPS sulfotransferase NodH